MMLVNLPSVPNVDATWVKLLDQNGLAVVFAMFCIFVVLPCSAVTFWLIIRWVSTRIDKLLDSHSLWMDRLVVAQENLSEKLLPMYDIIEGLESDHEAHYERSMDKLNHVHKDVTIIYELISRSKKRSGPEDSNGRLPQ